MVIPHPSAARRLERLVNISVFVSIIIIAVVANSQWPIIARHLNGRFARRFFRQRRNAEDAPAAVKERAEYLIGFAEKRGRRLLGHIDTHHLSAEALNLADAAIVPTMPENLHERPHRLSWRVFLRDRIGKRQISEHVGISSKRWVASLRNLYRAGAGRERRRRHVGDLHEAFACLA